MSGFPPKALDDRRNGKAPGAIGAIEQSEHPILAGNVGHGRAERMGVAQPGHFRFQKHQHMAGKSDHRMDCRRQRHRHIDDDVIEPLAEQAQHMPHPLFRDVQLRIQILIGGNQPHALVDVDRRAFEEQRVRPHRVFQSDAQPRSRPNAQHHGCLAALQMKVEQRDLGLCRFGQLQREIDRDARGSGAALGAADRDHMPAAIRRIGRHVAKQLRAQLGLDHIARERLRKVFAQAEIHKRAVE